MGTGLGHPVVYTESTDFKLRYFFEYLLSVCMLIISVITDMTKAGPHAFAESHTRRSTQPPSHTHTHTHTQTAIYTYTHTHTHIV